MTTHINKLAIFGVGLIGGSVALALKQAAAVGEVVGVGRSRANLDAALKLGIIDRIATTAAAAVQGADVVLLAVPVGQMAALMLEIAPHLGAETVITDAGSTKQDVAALMQQHLAAHLPNCVPGHPIAGAETCGAAAARAGLYQGRNVVLTPLPQSNKAALEKVRALWQACGAKVSEMPATQHDAIFATVSHLPHLLAYTLVDMIARRDNADTLFSFAASGFRDFTRIAGSSPEMWRDIALANRQALLNEIEQYQASLEQMRIALTAEDAAALEATFKRAQTARVRWSEE
ncbi:cyclohexadienyl dehydrogenase [Sulfuriferula multivorans]|uniref:prephenate dehydrogenase n=1 Tax=Sulfuriferula multivorans TaxID=1559896 RepID=A0A401JBT2_9PROT|nr:prephenate dehydrogenase/arogenate dehydrogenase family protein [Sulfuriferula multivorans]GBL45000.1 cyclohexadienyl dehydrogenase [Sulfuriferula multivorans]